MPNASRSLHSDRRSPSARIAQKSLSDAPDSVRVVTDVKLPARSVAPVDGVHVIAAAAFAVKTAPLGVPRTRLIADPLAVIRVGVPVAPNST
jgi:hypothetical protein